jgi:hypothetical protein
MVRLQRARAAFGALPARASRQARLAVAADLDTAIEDLKVLRAEVRDRLLSIRRHVQPGKAYAKAARLAHPKQGDRP